MRDVSMLFTEYSKANCVNPYFTCVNRAATNNWVLLSFMVYYFAKLLLLRQRLCKLMTQTDAMVLMRNLGEL